MKIDFISLYSNFCDGRDFTIKKGMRGVWDNEAFDSLQGIF